MSYALLWVEVLVIFLLFTATFAALGARRSGRLGRGLLMGVGTVLPAVLLLLALFMAVVPWVVTGEMMARWVAVLAWMLALYCIGAVIIRLAGRRPDAITGEARMRSWSPGRLGVALLVTVAVLLMTLWNIDLQAQLAIQSTRTEAGAIAASVAPPDIPDQQNAALIYERAFALLPPKDVWNNLTATDSKADPLSPEVRKLLEDQAKTLELLRRAADMPGCRFERDYAHPDWAALAPEHGLHKGAILLGCAARSETARGDIAAAMEDCRRMYQIGEHAATSPSIVTLQIKLGARRLADQAVAGVLPRVTDARQLELLQEQEPDSLVRAARRAIRGEEALGLAVICDWVIGSDATAILPEDPEIRTLGGLPVLGMFGRIFFLRDEVREYRNAFRHTMAEIGTPYYQIAAERGKAQTPKPRGWVAGMMVPSLDRYPMQIARGQALGDSRRIAVAATRYRLEHGGYPSEIGQLVPKYLPVLPLDPFDGKPMRMKATDAGLVIYSIGDDGKDDGGAIHGENRKAVDYGLLLANRP